jgi:hypothetical protein
MMISKRLTLVLPLVASIIMIVADTKPTRPNIKVVFAGFGRTGTHSLGAALERLGYRALHGEEISRNSVGTHQALAQAIIDQDVPEMLRTTSDMGYNATLEHHGMFWREIRQILPPSDSTKYIFILRDFDSWWESIVATIEPLIFLEWFPLNMIPLHEQLIQLLVSGTANELQVSQEVVRTKFFRNPNSTEHHQARLQAYDRYVKEAKEITSSDPAHNLLFDMEKNGFSYQILCQFLEIDAGKCPVNEPYPHISDRSEMTQIYYFVRVFEAIIYLLGVAVPFGFWKIVVAVISFCIRSDKTTKEKTQ